MLTYKKFVPPKVMFRQSFSTPGKVDAYKVRKLSRDECYATDPAGLGCWFSADLVFETRAQAMRDAVRDCKACIKMHKKAMVAAEKELKKEIADLETWTHALNLEESR